MFVVLFYDLFPQTGIPPLWPSCPSMTPRENFIFFGEDRDTVFFYQDFSVISVQVFFQDKIR